MVFPAEQVYQITAKVFVNGVDVGADVKTITVDRDIPSGLPGQSGFRSATGTITAVRGDIVSDTVATPWSRTAAWPPQNMDLVEIYLSDGHDEWRKFVGHVSDVTGTSESRLVSFDIQDNYTTLERTVTVPALSNSMPSLEENTTHRYIGLQVMFITDWVLRAAGRYCTPPRANGCVVSATLQGSTWPEHGKLLTSQKQTPDEWPNNNPNFTIERWGRAAQNMVAHYEPQIWSGMSGKLSDRDLVVTQEIADGRPGLSSLNARFGETGGRVGLAFNDTTVFARYWFMPSGGTFVTLASLPRNGRRASAKFSLNGGTLSADLRVLLDDGETVQDTGSRSGVTVLDGVLDRVIVTGDRSIGAFQVGFTPAAETWDQLNFTPNAVVHASERSNSIYWGFPTRVNATVLDFLNEQSAATLSQWWIDEDDVLQWWERGAITSQPTVGVLTSADHVKSVPWRHSFDQVKHGVGVKYKEATTVSRGYPSLTVWQGPSATLESGETDEEFFSSPDNEVWFGVETEGWTNYRSGTSSWGRLNAGRGTVLGGIVVNDSGEALAGALTSSIRRITDDTWVVKHTAGTLDTDERIALKIHTEDGVNSGIRRMWRGENLPIVRARKKVVLSETEVFSEITGPTMAPDFVHDAGLHVQHEAEALALVDYVAEHVTHQQATVESMEIIPVLGLRAGDVVDLWLPHKVNLEGRALVTGVRLSADLGRGTLSQSVSLLPISISATSRTWTEFGEQHMGDTWSDFGAENTGTWAEFGTEQTSTEPDLTPPLSGETWADFGDAKDGDTWDELGEDRDGDTWNTFRKRPLD